MLFINNLSLEVVDVNIKDALGRRIHETATSRISSILPFPVATKHGYAIMSETKAKKMEATSNKVSNMNTYVVIAVYYKYKTKFSVNQN